MSLGVHSTNIKAINLYKKLGWKQDGNFNYKEYKLGFIPRNMNKDISKFCEQGYADIFEVRINRIAPDENPEDQIGVIVYLKQASALSDDTELL